MIAYVDSSVLVRAYLPDDAGHEDAVGLLSDRAVAKVTGTWTRIEVSGALVRAARAGRGAETDLLELLDDDLAGQVVVVTADQHHVERHALELVRRHGIRAMDAWHLATAAVVVPRLLAPNEDRAFATRDVEQARVAQELGFLAL